LRHIPFGIMILALALFIACGSDNGDSERILLHPMPDSEAMEEDLQMKSNEEWVRTQPVDVTALDLNQDGYVYQDPMDWNVIADEEGKCPQCGMFLVKVTIDEAIKNLKDNGYTIK